MIDLRAGGEGRLPGGGSFLKGGWSRDSDFPGGVGEGHPGLRGGQLQALEEGKGDQLRCCQATDMSGTEHQCKGISLN